MADDRLYLECTKCDERVYIAKIGGTGNSWHTVSTPEERYKEIFKFLNKHKIPYNHSSGCEVETDFEN